MSLLIFAMLNSDLPLKLYEYQHIPSSQYFPVGIYSFFPKLQLSFAQSLVIYLSWIATIVFSIFGIGPQRIILILLAVFSSVFLGIDENFGGVYNDKCLAMVIIILLCLSPLCYIKFCKRKFLLTSASPKVTESTLNFIFFITALFYIFAGIQKLRFTGTGFIDSHALLVVMNDFNSSYLSFLINQAWMSKALGTITIIFQISGLIFIFIKKYRFIFLISALFFHSGVDIFLSPSFFLHRSVFLFFIPWNRIVKFDSLIVQTIETSNYFYRFYPLAFAGIFSMNLYSAAIAKTIWPFSGGIMFAKGNMPPIKRRSLYVEKNDLSIAQIFNGSIFPLTPFRINRAISKIENHKEKLLYLSEVAKFEDIRFRTHIFQNLTSIYLQECTWLTQENFYKKKKGQCRELWRIKSTNTPEDFEQ